jgi:glucose uptake protein GlcU
MTIDSCGNSCGLIAAFIGVIGFGTFGAPLKSEAANSVDPDPFVLQTYKSTMCFLTSFLVLSLGEEYTFSPYGLLSGFLWVIGGASGIFGIRNSGLAISVGTWSAITVLVSFTWGIFIFGETVVSKWWTLVGISMMIGGFIGMTYFSSPSVIERNQEEEQQEEQLSASSSSIEVRSSTGDDNRNENGNTLEQPLLEEYVKDAEREEFEQREQNESGNTSPITVDENEAELSVNNDEVDTDSNEEGEDVSEHEVIFLGMKCDRRKLGIVGAITDGVLGGGNLIPMHYSAYHGEEYIISFATGAIIVTIFFWILRLGYNAHDQKSIRKGWNSLPSMHFRTLVFPGVLAGTLWSIGNIGQIMSVSYLGESIGMSIVQSSMIVSGMLGIFWFREIRGLKVIICWSISAFITFIGIIVLSYQHKA